MVRSLSVWVLLASTGLVCAQSPVAGPTAVTDGAGASLMVHEQGKQANKCQVLKTWLMPDGSRAFQAQSVISGEMLTVIESGPADAVTPTSKIDARATQVYHWGGSQAPPPGAPMPPDGISAPGATATNPDQPGKAPSGVSTMVHTKLDKGQLVTTVTTSGQRGNKPGEEKPAGVTEPVAEPLQPLPTLPQGYAPPSEPLPLPGDVSSQMPSAPTGVIPVSGFQMPTHPQTMPTVASQPTTGGGLPNGTMLPPGTGSVVASGGAQYLPVPIVTVPDYRNVPQVPQVRMPQPPQPPQPTGAPVYVPQQPAIPYGSNTESNAFSPAVPQLPPTMNASGYGQIAPTMPAQQQPTVMPTTPYGHPAQGGYPQQPNANSPQLMPTPAQQQAMQQAALQYAMQQSGMQQPPAMQSQPAQQQPQAASPAQLAPRQIDPAMQRQANASAPQNMHTLRNALLPSERELAVSRLVYVDWRAYPPVVQALVTAACDDPAASVRAAGVRAMAQMNINTVPVYTALQQLRNDGDPRVMQEVEQALAVLAPSLNGGQDVQPAGMMMPR